MIESTDTKQHSLHKDKAMEVEKDANTLSKDVIITRISILGKNEQELVASFEAFMN